MLGRCYVFNKEIDLTNSKKGSGFTSEELLELIKDENREIITECEEEFVKRRLCSYCKIGFTANKNNEPDKVECYIYFIFKDTKHVKISRRYLKSFKKALIYLFVRRLGINGDYFDENIVNDVNIDEILLTFNKTIAFNDVQFENMFKMRKCNDILTFYLRDYYSIDKNKLIDEAFPVQILDVMNPFSKCNNIKIPQSEYFNTHEEILFIHYKFLKENAEKLLLNDIENNFNVNNLTKCEVTYSLCFEPTFINTKDFKLFLTNIEENNLVYLDKIEESILYMLKCLNVESVKFTKDMNNNVQITLIANVDLFNYEINKYFENVTREKYIDIIEDDNMVYYFSTRYNNIYTNKLQYAIIYSLRKYAGVIVNYVKNFTSYDFLNVEKEQRKKYSKNGYEPDGILFFL